MLAMTRVMAVFVLMSLIGVGFMVVEIESRFGVSRWVSIGVIAAALAVLAMLAWLTQRVWDSLQPKIPVVAEENRLMHVEGPPWRRTETEAVDLCEVGWIGWDVDVFDRTETLWLCFYDRDPDLELTFLGFMARNRDAQLLGQSLPTVSIGRPRHGSTCSTTPGIVASTAPWISRHSSQSPSAGRHWPSGPPTTARGWSSGRNNRSKWRIYPTPVGYRGHAKV